MKKIGLKLINVNVTDIKDESGYIEALGKEAAAKAINEAKISVAEAKGLYEILTKQAEGYAQVVKAAGGDPTKAFQLLLIEKLPELVKTQVEAVKNIKIDKITVWDSGNGTSENGAGSTANFVSGMMKTVPPLNDLFNMAGLNLPTYLKGEKSENDPPLLKKGDKDKGEEKK